MIVSGENRWRVDIRMKILMMSILIGVCCALPAQTEEGMLYGLAGFPAGSVLPSDTVIGRLVDPEEALADQPITDVVREFFLLEAPREERMMLVHPELRSFFLAMYGGLVGQLPVDRVRIGEPVRFDDMARVMVRVEKGVTMMVYEVFCSDTTGTWMIESLE